MARHIHLRLGPRQAIVFLRVALGVGYLSAVADRFGIWGPPGFASVAWGNFHNFLLYTAKLNPWLPAICLPVVGWAVTVAEIALGIVLLLGIYLRIAGYLSGIMALVFALAMSFVLGIHSPLNYGVFVISAASFLLAAISGEKIVDRGS